MQRLVASWRLFGEAPVRAPELPRVSAVYHDTLTRGSAE